MTLVGVVAVRNTKSATTSRTRSILTPRLCEALAEPLGERDERGEFHLDQVDSSAARDQYVVIEESYEDVGVRAQHLERKADFALDKLREDRFGIFGHESLKPQKVVLRFNPDIPDTVAERIWHPSQKLKHHRDGSLTLEMKVVISDELRSWVAGWMDYVEVKRPTHLFPREPRQEPQT